jgi:2-succinyl-5-enolpyruvyl-6-hydroxy-3-cyclohexene-1-carboxylate synthase
MPSPDINQAWARCLVSELNAHGIVDAVICPGSRSAPLALALAEHPGIRTWSVIDERSAAFFALGLAKQSRVPAVLVSTSGTAGANFYPAVIEATYAHVPMLVLTADRPPELHGWGALQTITQQNLYGHFPRWFLDLGLPEPGEVAERHLRASAAKAVSIAAGRPSGVVHLNAPFREPLAPIHPIDVRPDADPITPSIMLVQPSAAPQAEVIAAIRERINGCERGVIVCGPREQPDSFSGAVLELGRSTGYPVFAEATSQVRFAGDGQAISHYEALLRHQGFASAHRPELILRFGGPLISKVLQSWLDHSGAYEVLFSDDGLLVDPNHAASLVVEGDAVSACRALAVGRSVQPTQWAAQFERADRRVKTALQRSFERESSLSEPGAIHHIVASLPPQANLFVSSSMPVRDLDCFASSSSGGLRVFANRGVNGIDGVISSALGVAANSSHPTLLTAGDLAVWHDLGGLLTAHRHRLSLTIVVFNNDGGGIFSFLPIAKIPAHFEELFGTPHGLGFSSVAALFGARYSQPRTAEELRDCVRESLEGGLHLIEVQTRRDQNVETHHRLFDQLVSAVGDGPWA